MHFSNHHEWDQACLTQSEDVFVDIAAYLHRGGYHPEALSTNYFIFYTLKGIDKPLLLNNLNDMFLEMDALVESLKSMWLWLCFNWRYYKKPVPEFNSPRKMIHDVWLDMVRRNCFPPYRKKRCRKNPMFFHKDTKICSFCNSPSKVPDLFHCLELLYLHAWSVISTVNWGRLIALAMTQPFTIHHIPHISIHHQFAVFKMLIMDEYNYYDE